MAKREKVNVDDIIGIVKTEEPTNSVEEVRKLRGRETMTAKRFTIKEIDNFSYGIKVTDIILDNGIELPQSTVCDLLNNLVKENEYLHKYNTNLQKQPLLFDVQTIPNTIDIMEANTQLEKENEELKKELFEISKELLWATSDEVDRALHYEDEVEELRKEIFE